MTLYSTADTQYTGTYSSVHKDAVQLSMQKLKQLNLNQRAATCADDGLTYRHMELVFSRIVCPVSCRQTCMLRNTAAAAGAVYSDYLY